MYVEAVVGFDAREMESHFAETWSPQRRALYLLRMDLDKPLSTDDMVWVRLFRSAKVDLPAWVGPRHDLWENLEQMQAFIREHQAALDGMRYWTIAMSFPAKQTAVIKNGSRLMMNKRRLLGTTAILGVMLALTLVLSGQAVKAASPPTIANCTVFPADNPWNQDVSGLPVIANSPNYIASINANHTTLHPDFGSNPTYGIPYVVVPNGQAPATITFTDFGSESDPGPYPIPDNAPVEGAGQPGDRHVLTIDGDNCKLYELYNARKTSPLHWDASSGAVFNLNSNALRTLGWTSADAAGLPIFPGLVRYDEIQAGAINHALRFTVSASQAAYILPATHFASNSTNPNLPPMGLRLRLKASYDISGYTGASLIILQALKTYGMIVADNGSSWYISGATDNRWDDNDLNQLKNVPGSAFEAVYTGPLITHLSGPGPSPANAAPPRNYFTIAKPTLTWNRVTWAIRYDIEIAENSSFIGAVRYDAHNTLSFTWPSSLPNGPYYWHVRACSTATTCGLWSAWDTFVVDVP